MEGVGVLCGGSVCAGSKALRGGSCHGGARTGKGASCELGARVDAGAGGRSDPFDCVARAAYARRGRARRGIIFGIFIGLLAFIDHSSNTYTSLYM